MFFAASIAVTGYDKYFNHNQFNSIDSS